MLRRFEFKDARSYKFWEITVEGTSFTVRYGKVGTDGSTSTKSYPTEEKAQAEAEKKIKSKTKKGYAEVATSSAAASKKSSKADAAAEWAVRADKLQAAGDPWGQRIAIFDQWEAAKGAGKRKWKKQLKELDEEHGEHFYGAALQELMADKQFEKVGRFEWKHGYVVRARIGAPEYGHDGPKPEAILDALLQSPAATYLEDLILGLPAFDDTNYSDMITSLSKAKLEHLEKLFIGEFSYPDDTEISWVHVGDIAKAVKGMPNLRTLRVRGGGVSMKSFKHDKLQRLEVESGGLPSAGLSGFAKAKLPELTHVSLWLGRDNYGGSTNIGDLDALWKTKAMPKLVHLGLQNSEMQDAIASALAQAPLLKQLSSVDMSMGTMRAEGAQALIDNAKNFKHLKSLKLDDNFIPYNLHADMKKALGSMLHIGRQESPEDWGDGELYYYTSVGE